MDNIKCCYTPWNACLKNAECSSKFVPVLASNSVPNSPRKPCWNRTVRSAINAPYSSSKNMPTINEVVPFLISMYNKCWPYFTVSKCVPTINVPYLHLETRANNLSPRFLCPLKISSSYVLEFVPFSLLELSLIHSFSKNEKWSVLPPSTLFV